MEQEIKNQKDEQIRTNVCDIFTLIKDDKGKVCIAVGKYLVSEKRFNNFKSAENYILKKPYDIIVNLMCLTIKMQKDDEKEKKRSKKTAESTAKNKETTE